MGIMKIVVPIHMWVGRVKWILTTVPGSEYKFKKHELYQLSQFGELVDSQTSRPQLWTPSWKILTHTSTQMLMLFLGFTELPCHHLPGLEPPCRKQLATDKESVFSYANQVPHCQDAFSLYVNRQRQRELLMGLEMGKERTGSYKLVIHRQFPSGKQRDWVPRSIQPRGELGLWSRDLTKSASPPQFFSVPYRSDTSKDKLPVLSGSPNPVRRTNRQAGLRLNHPDPMEAAEVTRMIGHNSSPSPGREVKLSLVKELGKRTLLILSTSWCQSRPQGGLEHAD